MKDDLISRQAILKHIEKIRQGALMMDDTRRASIIMNGMDLCEEAVRNQPSAQPEKMQLSTEKTQLSEEDATKDATFDYIDRQAVLDKVNAWTYNLCDNEDEWSAIKEIKELPSAQRWIPVTERLPENNEEVLTTYIVNGNKNKRYTETATYYDGDGGEWSSPWDEYRVPGTRIEVIAWMPLPEPWRGEEHEL